MMSIYINTKFTTTNRVQNDLFVWFYDFRHIALFMAMSYLGDCSLVSEKF
jgi:hypothetical protein